MTSSLHSGVSKTSSRQLETLYPPQILAFASPAYWPEAEQRQQVTERLRTELRLCTEDAAWVLVDSEEALEQAMAGPGGGIAAFLPLSGAIQPWMRRAAEHFGAVALLNPYLPEGVSEDLAHEFLHRNAHPASADFFACEQMAGHAIFWMDSPENFPALARAWQACQRLKHARILKVGETEPWVINSTRAPQIFAERLGTEIIPVDRQELYEMARQISCAEAAALSADWMAGASVLEGVVSADIEKACRVFAAMKNILGQYGADGLSMACFAMIGDIDTTSCLALSALNDSALAIGACEGDLDAAVTLFLLKALGCGFVWVANPIIRPGGVVDLAHCTAPRCMQGKRLSYRLLRHHESGRGVAPEVELPGGTAATIVRLGDGMRSLAMHTGVTERIGKLDTCHTQIRLRVDSSQEVLRSLMGTHFVLTYGDERATLRYCADFLGLKINPDFTRH